MKTFILLAAILLCPCAIAGPLNTLIPPFTQPAGEFLLSNLTPQSIPAAPPYAAAGSVFGFGGLDANTWIGHVDPVSASVVSTWDQFAGAFVAASSANGQLKTYASTTGYPDAVDRIDAHASATFSDRLTITSAGLAPGALGYLNAKVMVTGSIACDAALCPTSLLFGYGPGTLGVPSDTVVHWIGGTFAPPGSLNLVEQLVPLPFRNGEPFNISLNLLTTARNMTAGERNTFNISNESHTMRVTEVLITDEQGEAISDYLINADSGLRYGPNGIDPVPEPSTGFLAVGSLAGLVLLRTRRCRQTGSGIGPGKK